MLSRFGGAIIFHIICFFYIICICVRQRWTWHCKARDGKKRRASFLRRRPRRRDKRQTCARRRPLQSRRRCVGARVGMCAVYRPRAPTKKHYPNGFSRILPKVTFRSRRNQGNPNGKHKLWDRCLKMIILFVFEAQRTANPNYFNHL